MIDEEKTDGRLLVIIGIVGRQGILSFEFSDIRYQRDELKSIEACDELRKRTDKEIADAEKKSAIRRKVEQAKAEQAKSHSGPN
jgi:hypothetical protein